MTNTKSLNANNELCALSQILNANTDNFIINTVE